MKNYKFSDLVARYGEPILKFKPHIEGATREQLDNENIPVECAIFEMKNNNLVKPIVWSSSFGDNWQCNYGERVVINELINKNLKWKYPAKGELPDNDNLVFCYFAFEVPELCKYNIHLKEWYDREFNVLKVPKCWCELPASK
jgi:hypothetical protein